jgi:ABC-2 type transport system permease protein
VSKFFSLSKVLMKDVVSVLDMKFGNKGGKFTGPILWGIVGLCMLPLIFVFYMLFQGVCAIFVPAGELAYITGFMFSIVCLVVLFFSIVSVPSVFYFSNDVETLLPLPLRPAQIIGAKFFVALTMEYGIALLIIAPMYAAYLSYLPVGSLTLNMLIGLLLLPVTPLAYSSIIVMVLMRLFRFGRNRDFYNLIIGLVALVFGAGIGIFSSQLNTITPEQAVELLEGNRGVLDNLRSIFPGTLFAGRAVANGEAGAQLINIAITAGVVALFLFLSKFLYFKSVIGISESSAPSRKMTKEEVLTGARSSGIFASYLQKELRLLFRNPTALMNCVLMVFLMPALMIGSMAFQLSNTDIDLSGLLLAIDYNNPRVVSFIMAGAAAAGIFISCMNLVTCTCISREGKNYIFMKYVPVSYRTQLNAKAASGLAVSVAGLVLFFAGLEIIFKAPLTVFLGALILSLPGGILMNYLGMLIDLAKPKLVWDNEQRAVKQNVNSVILIFGGMFLAAVIGVVGGIFLKTPLTAFVTLLIVTGALAFGSMQMVLTMGESYLEKLNV